ncbi:MAG: VTT domain-containing protein [Terricaulis silvestris]
MPPAKAFPLRLPQLLAFLVLGAVTLIGFTAPFLPHEFTSALGPWLTAARSSNWGPIAAIAAYAVFATLGVPQIVLITALVAVFGPWAGFLYSWTGKMLACSIGFAVGRRFGAQLVERYGNERVKQVAALLARRGFTASALIRMVPTVPSVLVNIAAGATAMRFRDFIAGTALGSVPKMALFAFGGQAAMSAVQDNSLWAWGLLGVVVLLWFTLGYLGRRWMKRVDAN